MSSSPTVTLDTPHISSSQPQRKDNIEEALSKPFEPLDVQSVVATFDNESAKQGEFESEFNEMLLSAMLDVKAWAMSRPVSEQDIAGDALAIRVREVERTQDEQEQTRLRLLSFIRSIKSALAALTSSTII